MANSETIAGMLGRCEPMLHMDKKEISFDAGIEFDQHVWDIMRVEDWGDGDALLMLYRFLYVKLRVLNLGS